MIYVATRRVGENVWARMVENVIPNLQQVSPIWEDGKREHGFTGPMMSRWIMSLDNTNTMLIELRHISEAEGVTPARFADRDFTLPQQTAAPTYEEGQRRPGDYEAQVSQRPIAIHDLEHLGVIDRGVSMFRRLVRQGIRTVRNGGEPKGICHVNGGPIPTYCNDTVVRAPAAESPEADARLLRETGRRLAEAYLRGIGG